MLFTYTYGSDLISVGRTVPGEPSATIHYFGYDGLGSVRALTNTTGNVTDSWDYDAFGNITARTGTTDNAYLYRGEQYDADLGMYYLRARFYNQTTGRFWNQDSYEGSSGDPASLHKYLYANGNPVSMFDSSGNISLTDVMVAVSIGTLLNNIATPVIATYLSAGASANLNDQSAGAGIVISLRGTATGFGVVGEGGVDVLWLPREGANGVYVFSGGDFGFNPISFWKKHKGLGVSASAGIVWGIDTAGDWSGGSVTATWPIPALLKAGPIFRRLGPTVNGGVLGMIEKLAYFNNRKQLFGVAQIGFSTSGPGFFRWGIASNSFTWEMGWLSQPRRASTEFASLFSGLSISSIMDNPTVLQDKAAALSH